MLELLKEVFLDVCAVLWPFDRCGRVVGWESGRRRGSAGEGVDYVTGRSFTSDCETTPRFFVD